MTRSIEEIERVMRLSAVGLNHCEIARRTGIPRSTLRMWRTGRLPRRPEPKDRQPCSLVHSPEHEDAYAYLLGQYLGDGYIATHPNGVHRLRIACTTAYPDIMDEVEAAIRLVMPANRVRRVTKVGCTEIASYSKHWPCLFPQHGRGRKHERPIVLTMWQQELVDHFPEQLIRGMIHSDGWRGVNRVKGTDYPRYQFTNRSDDIRGIFTNALDRLEIEWKVMNRWNISVARRASVARLDEFVGPKS